MKKLFFLPLFIFTLFYSSCKRDVPTPQPAAPPVPLQDLTAYSYFKTGTYWIYKDSATAILDSVYVPYDTSYSYYQNNRVQAAGNYMYYDTRTYSYLDNHYCYLRISMGYYGLSDGHLVGVERTTNLGTSYLMSNEFIIGQAIYHPSSPGVITCQGFNDSININGISYNKVVHFHDTKNASELTYTTTYGYCNPTTDFYIAKNIGIVRKRIRDYQFNTVNRTWNLVRYHINQ
jgi:hypothetical protein